MAAILAGNLATSIVRIGAVTDERLDAKACNRILAHAYPSREAARAIQGSVGAGACKSFLRRHGLKLVEAPASAPADASDPAPVPMSAQASAFAFVLPRNRSARPPLPEHVRYASCPLADESLLRVAPELDLGEETYVVSPALNLVLESARMDDVDALEIAMETCGTYVLSSEGALLTQLPSACTPSSLVHGVQELARAASGQRMPGLARALRMAPFALGSSASPMETKVAIMLSLPVSFGGWGVQGLVLNRRMELTNEQREIAGKPYLVLDGYLASGHIGYEYDSREYHDRADRDYRDRVRVTVAQCLDIKLLSLTADIVMDEERCTSFCDEFARLAGKRPRTLGMRTIQRRHRLRQRLGLPLGERSLFQDGEVPLEAYEAFGYGA